jgi:hypothetical protein
MISFAILVGGPTARFFVVVRCMTQTACLVAGKGTIGKYVISVVVSTIGTWHDATESVAAAVFAVVTCIRTNTTSSLRLLLLLGLLGRRLL